MKKTIIATFTLVLALAMIGTGCSNNKETVTPSVAPSETSSNASDSTSESPTQPPTEVASATETSSPVATEEVAAENIYAGVYRNNIEEIMAITITEDGRLQYNGEDIDISNEQEDGSILAGEKHQPANVASSKMFIYPAGIELSAWDHSTSTDVASDEGKIRLFFTYSDVPDINHNVYYKVEHLQPDELSVKVQ